jgi:hypothetical protein
MPRCAKPHSDDGIQSCHSTLGQVLARHCNLDDHNTHLRTQRIYHTCNVTFTYTYTYTFYKKTSNSKDKISIDQPRLQKIEDRDGERRRCIGTPLIFGQFRVALQLLGPAHLGLRSLSKKCSTQKDSDPYVPNFDGLAEQLS